MDVEKSASRTTDPEALADTDNPTLGNAACTVCHAALDPVAGAFQNYSDIGNYRANFGGADSLDRQYKTNLSDGVDFPIEARTWEQRETVSIEKSLLAGERSVGLTAVREQGRWAQIGVDRLTIRGDDDRVVSRHTLGDLEDQDCGQASGDYYQLPPCLLVVPVDIPRDGDYLIEVEAWDWNGNNQPDTLRMSAGDFHRRGDTWYRDMRAPGFDAEPAPSPDNSVQWLAERIVADDRFAEAAVKFWWPAMMGARTSCRHPNEPATRTSMDAFSPPAPRRTKLRAWRKCFAAESPGGDPYNLKHLLVEIVLSNWFRTDAVEDDNPVRCRRAAGCGRQPVVDARGVGGQDAVADRRPMGQGETCNGRWRPSPMR